MKYLVASDIHGSLEGALAIAEKIEKKMADKVILLGDILYHGPRNPLPEDYNPMKVAENLNKISEKIIAVKGNCDSEVDQMVLNFMLNDSAIVEVGKKSIFLTHGQHVSPEKPAKVSENTVVLYGHFHKICKNIVENITYINVGSIGIPKDGTVKCYSILDENGLNVYDLKDKLVESFEF